VKKIKRIPGLPLSTFSVIIGNSIITKDAEIQLLAVE